MFTDLITSIDTFGLISPTMSNIQKMEVLEWYLKNEITAKKPEDYDYEHIFGQGVYIRRLKIPAGDLVIGMQHKTFHLNRIVSGHGFVMSGYFASNVRAGFRFYSDVGDKKIVMALTDMTYETRHVTSETDLEKLKQATVCESDLSWIEELLCLG